MTSACLMIWFVKMPSRGGFSLHGMKKQDTVQLCTFFGKAVSKYLLTCEPFLNSTWLSKVGQRERNCLDVIVH